MWEQVQTVGWQRRQRLTMEKTLYKGTAWQNNFLQFVMWNPRGIQRDREKRPRVRRRRFFNALFALVRCCSNHYAYMCWTSARLIAWCNTFSRGLRFNIQPAARDREALSKWLSSFWCRWSVMKKWEWLKTHLKCICKVMCFGRIFKPFVRKVVMVIINDIQQEATFV